MNPSPIYANTAPHASYPLGGIGTGTISLHASGQLTEFEIFNRPSQGKKLPYSFFAMHSEWAGHADTRVLEAPQTPDFDLARGCHPHRVMGLPRFAASTMQVNVPFARVEFEDDALPLQVSLTAFNPLIPLCEDDSGIPAALFRFRVRNISGSPARVLVACSMPDIHNHTGFDCMENYLPSGQTFSEARRAGGVSGLFMDGRAVPADALTYANNAILTPGEDALILPAWRRGGWWDGVTSFWDSFCRGELQAEAEGADAQSAIGPAGCRVGTVGMRREIAPGGSADFTFVLSWYVPNRVRGWFAQDNPGRTMKNYYATRFSDAWEAGACLLQNADRLEAASRRFSDALYGSTLPPQVVEAAAANLTVLRSNTCWRCEDGTFMAWEGCLEQEGSCHGTCTHVWNYAQAAAFLFPGLERSARLNEFLVETAADGKMSFRTQQRFGLPPFDMHAAADGQLGTIVRAYREYLLGGGEAFLRAVYPAAQRALSYAERTWDPDGDGLLEARQHNTYDIEFFGVNPLSGVFYLAALRAMEEMARALGLPEDAGTYRERFVRSSKLLDERCFTGEYYVQLESAPNAHPYQFGRGCLSDQLLGQTLACLTGLGGLLPEEHLQSAAAAIFRHNFLTGDARGACLQRLYVAPDEPGLVLCSWPDSGKPDFPFVYSDEVWTGVEYQVATLLVCEGMVDEALRIVRAVRRRYDGVRRNPFSEIECGYHYARSLASWGLIPALSGFTRRAEGGFTFSPRVCQDDFHCFFSDGSRWGVLHQTRGEDGALSQRVEVLGGAPL